MPLVLGSFRRSPDSGEIAEAGTLRRPAIQSGNAADAAPMDAMSNQAEMERHHRQAMDHDAMRAGAGNLPMLFVLLFISAGFSFGLLSLITGPIAAEAAPLGMIASTTGVIVAVGEIFGGGFAPAIAGSIAGKYGIQYTLYMALVGLIVGIVVSLFYKETAPAKIGKGAEESALDQLEDKIGGVA